MQHLYRSAYILSENKSNILIPSVKGYKYGKCNNNKNDSCKMSDL